MKACVAGGLAVMLLCASCTRMSQVHLGPLREVTVVTEDWEAIHSAVTRILQREIPTPQPEPQFRVRVGSPARFETFSRFRIVFLVGTPEDTLVRQVLGSRIDSLPDAGYQLFRVPNPWVKDQVALIFLARSRELLVPGLDAYADRIRKTTEDEVLSQMYRAVYIEGSDRSASEAMSRRYSLSVEVPRRWMVRGDTAGSRFVYLYAHFPDRGVFIHWEDAERQLSPGAVLRLRDSLTGLFYDGDSVDTSFAQVDTIDFLAVPCIRIRGVWRNERETTGGPFVSYALNYQGRFCLLDGIAFNPGKEKLDALYQVEAVLRTFTPR